MEQDAKFIEFWESKTKKSEANFERARKSVLGGIASFLHKAEYEDYPIYIESAKGSKIYDIDGNEYIDYMGAYGPVILGYSPHEINKAVIEQIHKGSIFAAPNVELNELSDKLVEIIPCANLVSYQSTGTETNMVCFRFARAFTGKEKIIKFEGHYHGWTDELLISLSAPDLETLGPRSQPRKVFGSAGQSRKSADDIIILPWNDLDTVRKTVEKHGHEIAAIVTEPVMGNCEPVFPAKPGFLEGLREITAQNGILLIFDEIITGFRMALGGAQEYYGVTPDLSTFGKAAGGGFQIAGVVGKREVMETGVHPGGTFNANPLAVAACLATIRELEKPGVYEHLADITKKLIDGVNALAKKHNVTLYCGGEGAIWQIQFGITGPMTEYRDNFKVDKETYRRFRMLALARGIRIHPVRARFYTSTAHTEEDVDKTLEVFDEVFSILAKS